MGSGKWWRLWYPPSPKARDRGHPSEAPAPLLRQAAVDVGADCFEVSLSCLDCSFGLREGDEGDVVKRIVALAAHAVEEGEGWSESRVEVRSGELDDGDVMAELHPRSLAVAEHEGERAFQHCLIGGLVGGFFVDPEVLTSGSGFFVRVGEEAAHLFGIDLLGPGSGCHR